MSESELSKSKKFVRLVEWLQMPSGVNAKQILKELDLDERTLRRYVADLREMGVPIQIEGRGAVRRLHVDAAYRRKGVEITLLEAVSLRFGRTLFNFLGGTQFASDMDDALERLTPFIRATDAAKVQDLHKKIIAVPEHAKDYMQMGELLDEVLTALLYQNPAHTTYTRPAGGPKSYELHPYTLVAYRQGLYLFAHDVEANRIKTFAVDRFQTFERQRDEHFDVPEYYVPEDLLDDCFGIMPGPVHTIEVRFSPKVAPYIRERVWHRSQKVHADSDGSVVLTMVVGIGPELHQWLLGFGADVKVVRPRSLADDIRKMHKEACK